jgi:hypothetical protein
VYTSWPNVLQRLLSKQRVLPKTGCMHIPYLKRTSLKRYFFTPINPFLNCDSVCLTVTCDNILFQRYLFCSTFCHTLSLLKSLNNHLLRKHLFLSLKPQLLNPLGLWVDRRCSILSVYIFLNLSICLGKRDR